MICELIGDFIQWIRGILGLEMKIDIPLDTGHHVDASEAVSTQKAVNLFVDTPEVPGARNSGVLKSVPGFDVVDLGTINAPISGAEWIKFRMFQGELHCVASNLGMYLFKVAANGTVSNIGAISSPGTTITPEVSDNGEVMVIVFPGFTGWFYEPGVGISQIVDANYTAAPALSVTQTDGYFVYCSAREIFIGSSVNVNKGMDFDGLDFSTAEVKPDDNIAVRNIHGELRVFGSDSTETFHNTRGSGFPFQNTSGAALEKGIANYGSVIEADGAIFFIGGAINEELAVWRWHPSGSLSKVSTGAIDREINDFGRSTGFGVYSFTYSRNGNIFVCFSCVGNVPGVPVPSTGRTFTYNIRSSAMLGRNVWNTTASSSGSNEILLDFHWKVNAMAEAYGSTYAGSRNENGLRTLSYDDFGDYDGASRRTIFSTSYIHNRESPLSASKLVLALDGTAGDSILMEYSDDSGTTWRSMGSRSIGSSGSSANELTWQRLGRIAQSRVFRFTYDGANKLTLIRLSLFAKGIGK